MQKHLMVNHSKHDKFGSVHPSLALVEKRLYARRLDENDILSLCDLLLMPGIHYVSFGSLTHGRRTINLFIEFLKCYYTIGFIDRIGARNHGMNLYELFAQYTDNVALRTALAAFFVEEFGYDFIWIVYPKYAVARTFIHIFLDQVIEFNVDQKIPIVFIST